MRLRTLIIFTLLVGVLATTSCVHRSQKCRKAAHNVKKLHLTNW